MISNVVVSLDGSSLAERALPRAAALARAGGGRLILLHARWGGLPTSLDLEPVAASLRTDGTSVETHVVPTLRTEETGQAIIDGAREHAGDLLVMSTHGRGGVGRLLFGSVADQVLRQADLPVLLVTARCEPEWPDEGVPRILVALDGSTRAEEVLAPATDLARALGAEVHLLTIVSGAGGQTVDATGRYLESVAERLRASDLTVVVHTGTGQVVPAITRLAEELGAWAIAITTHGHGGLARLVLGSTATELIHRSHAPLLVIRPPEMQQPAARAD